MGEMGFRARYGGWAYVGHLALCSRRNYPSDPNERALCVSNLCIYSSLDLSYAFQMLYDIRSNSSMGILNCCYWSGFKWCIRFAFSWYVALIFSSKASCLYSATALISSLWESFSEIPLAQGVLPYLCDHGSLESFDHIFVSSW
jgi:hypothetical protein